MENYGGFRHLSLPGQFALTGGLGMLVAMVVAGLFISSIVSKTAIGHTATSTALFIENFLSPLVQELAHDEVLPDEKIRALDHLLGGDHFGSRFPHVEIWKDRGLVAYSRTPALIGKRFTPPPELTAAFSGEVASGYANLKAREHVLRAFSERYLEIYIPIRDHLSGRIIAAAEIHEVPGPLDEKLSDLRVKSWLLIMICTLLMMLSLFGIVYRGNKLIDEQKLALSSRYDEMKIVSDHNRELREKAQRASSLLSEMNQRYLREVGAELHDGPAQLLGFASLMVEHARQARTKVKREEALKAIDTALAEAVGDIRTISKGLMLPEIEHLPLRDVVDRAVRIHEKRTGTQVEVQCASLAAPVSHAVKICVYRFVQEGLHNAFRHAGGEGQAVTCLVDDAALTVAVQDHGAVKTGAHGPDAGLGLTGLRERVESLGGTFRIQSAGNGTKIEMNLAVTA